MESGVATGEESIVSVMKASVTPKRVRIQRLQGDIDCARSVCVCV